MSYDGVFSFYLSRIMCAMTFPLREGDTWIGLIISAASNDAMLTTEEVNTIISMCSVAHQKLLEDDYNDGWD